MPFHELATMPLAAYIAKERAWSGPWFFLHVPKTAGSSFSSELPLHMSPYRNIEVDYTDHSRTHNEKLKISVDQFIRDMRSTSFRSASGHVPWEMAEGIRKADPRMRFVSFLRHPEARVISEYRYQRTATHPDHEAFKARFQTLESYVDWSGSQNQTVRFLFGKPAPSSNEELIWHLGHNFTILGLVEMYPLSFNMIFSSMGFPDLLPTEYIRKTEDTEDNHVEITPEIRKKIQEANALDVIAYEYVRSTLIKHRDQLWGRETRKHP